MDIKEEDILTTDELIKFLGVSKNTWKKKRNELLENFGRYYEYEIEYKGRNKYYHILKQLDEYKPIEKKSVKRDKIYETNIISVIEDDNIQTAMNVSRIIKNKEDIKNLKHTDGTIYEYTRVKMRTMFGTVVNEGGTKGIIEKKIWCKLMPNDNYYEELTEKEINYFYDIFRECKEEIKDEELEVFSDYQNGLITKDEMEKLISDCGFNCFISARNIFKNKYGYFPIKVPVYLLNIFNEGDK